MKGSRADARLPRDRLSLSLTDIRVRTGADRDASKQSPMPLWHRLVIVAAVIVASAILAKLLDLRIHDHVIIGRGRFASLAERGVI